MQCDLCDSIRENFSPRMEATQCGHVGDCPRCDCFSKRVSRESEHSDLDDFDTSDTPPNTDDVVTPHDNPKIKREG